MQPGFFDLDERYAKLDAFGDPLARLDELVDWEAFRAELDRVHDKPRKSEAGRKPLDVVMMFKLVVLQHLYGLADEQVEFQVRDRYSFARFLGLSPEDRVPDARTLWVFRERLSAIGGAEGLFEALMAQIEAAGYQARKGQIVDAALVSAPRQRNSREENDQLRAGEEPAEWAEQPAKRRQKDTQARWTFKHGAKHYGYKNHVSVDRAYKLVRRYDVTDAATHDSQRFGAVLDGRNTNRTVWADAAYRSQGREAELVARGFRSQLHRRGHKHQPLSARSARSNRRKSRIRARVEHVFADQTAIGGRFVRTIGMERARLRIGLVNLAYNLRRWAWLAGHVPPDRRPLPG